MLEHLPHLAEVAAKAIANVKFDKVVVWDGGANGNGKHATASFLQGLAGSLPPVMQMMRDIGGVELPGYFGKLAEPATAAAVADEPVAAVRGNAAPAHQAAPKA